MADANSFALQLDKFCDVLDLNMREGVTRLALYAYRGVIKKSPVDTGRFRASWTMQEGEPNYQFVPAGKKGSKLSAPSEPPLKLKSPYTIVWIANGLPYAARLENGWSKQAPSGMVRLTMHEVSSFVTSIVNAGGI